MTREQFIQTVKCEQRGLRRFLLTLCRGDRMTADDIAQETLVKAYLALDKYDERSKAKVWLMKIAYNTFLNHRIHATRYHYEDIEEADSLRGEDAADNYVNELLAKWQKVDEPQPVAHYYTVSFNSNGGTSVASQTVTSGNTADNTFRFQQLEQAMAQLPETERTTLVLHYFEGYKVEEIAQITDSSEAAVKKRLQRGREELKRRIEK